MLILTPVFIAAILLGCEVIANGAPLTPWKAWPSVEVRGREVRIWARRYLVGDLGLPDQITSVGGKLLVSPISLDFAADGRLVEWRHRSVRWLQTESSCARYSFHAEAADLLLKIDGLIEPDGMWRCDVELKPACPITLDRLRIVIPFSSRHAKLMHSYPLPRNWPKVTFPDYRYPNSGALPRKWKSPFTPFVWIGDEERGLEWFCESDKNWRPRSPKSALTIERANGAVEFAVHIVERPLKLTAPFRFTFGVQAGPVKPKSPHLVQGEFGYSHWGEYGMESEVRAGSEVTQLDYLKGLGMRFVGMHENWTDFEGMPCVTEPEKLRHLIEEVHKRGMGLVLYHSLALPDIAPEFRELAEDCLCEPRSAHYVHHRQPEQRDYAACHQSKYPAIWADGINDLFKDYGIDGLYLDGAACPIACANSRHGCGYTDEAGGVHPTYPIFAARETMKRLRTICDAQDKPTLIVAHMSSMITLPSLSFADVLLTGEQYWKSPEDFRPPIEFFRAECMGHNHGLPTHFIGYSPLGGEYARTMIALHNAPSPWCPGGVEMWRLYKDFDADGAEWVPYWSRKTLARADGGVVPVSGFIHPSGRSLLAVGNLEKSKRKVQLVLGERIRRFRHATDPLTGTEIEIKNGTIKIELGPESLQWIWLEGAIMCAWRL